MSPRPLLVSDPALGTSTTAIQRHVVSANRAPSARLDVGKGRVRVLVATGVVATPSVQAEAGKSAA